MSETNSTPTIANSKPTKPYPAFPLTPHPAGYWCKKIRGKLHYFGKLDDPDAALNKYLAERDALHAGREPRQDPEALTVKDVANAFIRHKQSLVDAGEMSQRTLAGYKEVCEELLGHFGKRRLVSDIRADDFGPFRARLAKKWGPWRLAGAIQTVRSVFKHAFDVEIIDKPVRFGTFKRPSKKVMRLHRAAQGKKLFTADEIRRLLKEAGAPMRAMILLGINVGFGNNDCAALPLDALDLKKGWLDFPRPKTGVERRCPLWPKTIAALKKVIAKRHQPKDPADAKLVFITKYGFAWGKETTTNPVCQEFAKLLRALKINGRKGLGFYTLRHTFRTVADSSRDQPAVDHIMGHSSDSMASVYREGIGNERLLAVVQHVHAWLFAK